MNFIIYDLEATCWLGRPPKGYNEIIEIGAYKLNIFGEELGSFSKFVRPTVNPKLSGFCKRLTSITQENVDRASTFPTVFQEFLDWIDIDEDFILCSWGDFDIQFLRNDCDLHRLDKDSLHSFTNLKNQYQRIKALDKGTGLKSTLKKEGFEFTGVPHRAISDALNLCKIFKKYIDEWYY